MGVMRSRGSSQKSVGFLESTRRVILNSERSARLDAAMLGRGESLMAPPLPCLSSRSEERILSFVVISADGINMTHLQQTSYR